MQLRSQIWGTPRLEPRQENVIVHYRVISDEPMQVHRVDDLQRPLNSLDNCLYLRICRIKTQAAQHQANFRVARAAHSLEDIVH
jgi:hypothetical protein